MIVLCLSLCGQGHVRLLRRVSAPVNTHAEFAMHQFVGSRKIAGGSFGSS